MWLSILQNIIISMLVIFLAHHLILHMKDTYTVKKTKDLTELQEKKYKTILDEVFSNNEKEKNDLLQLIEETKSMVQENIAVKEEVEEDGLKNILTENDLKQMNDDLDSFVQSQIMGT
jgi:mannitol-specific phosphotransferase system IIBC component